MSFLVAGLISFSALAHQGVTYPLVVDKELATEPTPSTFSIIADPDLNKGILTFVFKSTIDLQSLKITTASSPIADGKKILNVSAEYSPEKKNFVATIPFDSEGDWTVHFMIQQNDKTISEFEMPLEVVPEGPSRKDFAIYTLPFLILLGVALRIVVYKRKSSVS